MAGPETEEHKLRRLLYTGSTSPVVYLRGGLPKTGSNTSIIIPAIGGIKKGALMKVANLVGPNVGNINLALQHCLAARDRGQADNRALFLVLSACLQIDCKQTRTATYQVIKSLIHQSTEDFFEFVYYHEKMFKNKPRGMGAGMRRLISEWYHDMDAYELVLEIFRVKSRHFWKHKDLISLARVRSDDIGKSVVLSYLMQGNKKTQHRFKGESAAQPILDYLACMRELNQCRDPQHALTLIVKHSFDLELIGTELLNDESIWEHCVPRTSLRGILARLKKMTFKGFLTDEDSPVKKKVEAVLRDKHALRASKLQPSEILGVLTQVEAGFALSPDGHHKSAHVRRVPKFRPHPSLQRELAKMLDSSSINVAKLPCKIHICVDIQSNKQQCWGAWNLSCLRAVSLTVFSLLHADSDLTLSYYKADRLKFIDVNKEDTMATILGKLTEKAETAGRVQPEGLLRWNRESGANTDLVMMVTDSNIIKGPDDIWAELEQAKVNNMKVKFIHWALASKRLEEDLTNENYPNILGINGWSPDSTRIIQTFAQDFF